MKFRSTLIFILFSYFSFGQVLEFDKLEMWYAQKHYRTVYKKANAYLSNPNFSFSELPKFYVMLSSLQLSKNDNWRKKNPKSVDNAMELYKSINSTEAGKKVLKAHVYELAFLKLDLNSWIEELKQKGEEQLSQSYSKVMSVMFQNIPNADEIGQVEENIIIDDNLSNDLFYEDRLRVIDFAKQHIGIPYVWAGVDTSGFDCSGFTSYVMKNYGKTIPRRAVDQYESSKKIKEKYAKPGDLVFFDNGSGISHVGMIVSNKGDELTMIHSSSSKGIIVTDIKKSNYWLPRLFGFGTYIY